MLRYGLHGAGDAMNLKQAAEMALKQLDRDDKYLGRHSKTRSDAMEALRQVLAQPEQSKTYAAEDITAVVEAMVTAFKLRREWVGLTDEEQDTIARMANDSLDAICLTETKLEEKNSV